MINEAVVAVAELGTDVGGAQETPTPRRRPSTSEGSEAPPEHALRPPNGEATLRRPEALGPRGTTPPRKWGPYSLYRNDGSPRRLPRFVQVKLVNFYPPLRRVLFAFAPRACIVEGLVAAGITRRTYNRWLLAIPAFAADIQDIRDEHTDRDELELDARIRKGDGAALRMKLRANRPEKYDPRWRRAATADAPPVSSTALLALPQHRAPQPRIDLVRTALAHSAALAATAAVVTAPIKKRSLWDEIEGVPPVLK